MQMLYIKYIVDDIEFQMMYKYVWMWGENETTGSIKPVYLKQIAEGKSRTEKPIDNPIYDDDMNTMREKLIA